MFYGNHKPVLLPKLAASVTAYTVDIRMLDFVVDSVQVLVATVLSRTWG